MNGTIVKTEAINSEQIDLIKRTICIGASNDELRMFIGLCQRTGLDPFSRQVYAIKRWNGQLKREVMSFQVSIDGLRLIAERTEKYAGQLGAFWCGEDGEWKDCWLASIPPAAAKVGVLRHDFKEPVWGVARFSSYAQFNKNGELTSMWAKMPEVMIAKCAEAIALRRSFPQELSGIYEPTEIGSSEIKERIETLDPHLEDSNDVNVRSSSPSVGADAKKITEGLNQTDNSLRQTDNSKEPSVIFSRQYSKPGNPSNPLIDQTTAELKRLSWTNAQGRLYLQENFSKSNRAELTETELRLFLEYLRSQK